MSVLGEYYSLIAGRGTPSNTHFAAKAKDLRMCVQSVLLLQPSAEDAQRILTARAMLLPLMLMLNLANGLPTNIWLDESGVEDLQSSSRVERVLNFFPVPVEEECIANDSKRRGVCMNPYECRMQSGSSKGPCALGFGVCCVFTATCDQDVFNNVTYFVNPDYPDLTKSQPECVLKIKKVEPDVAQIKLDFLHFNLGQPNRKTGVCDEDIFTINGGLHKDLTLCGINNGQHAYLDLDDSDEPLTITMNMSRKFVSRIWEIRITQIPFAQRAPAGCFQYYTGNSGVIQTMNFAENGRRLANQDYTICMRQEQGMCSITYEPCDANSFKINSNNTFDSQTLLFNNNNTDNTENPVTMETTTIGQTTTWQATTMQTTTEQPLPTTQTTTEIPQDDLTEVGSGDGGVVQSRAIEAECSDRIVLPCDAEDFLMPSGRAGSNEQGNCNLAHCGSSLCPAGEEPCRVESDVLPFTVGVQFGPSEREDSPEDNIGMCLNYQQQPCLV